MSWRIRVAGQVHGRGGAFSVDLDESARRLCVVGPSGCGKSTLLRVLAGVEPFAGHVQVGEAIWQSPQGAVVAPEARGVGWVPQDAPLFPHVDVRTNLLWSAPEPDALDPLARALEVEELLARRPATLSGGERARVALGRALLRRPGLLLLDEPFAALDRPLRGRVARAVEAAAPDVPLVLVSHDERDAALLGCQVVALGARGVDSRRSSHSAP